MADAEFLDPVGEILRADDVLHVVGHGDVGGLGQRLLDRHVLGVVAVVVVVHDVVADEDLGGDVEGGVLGEGPGLEADGGREDLEDRAGLERVAHELEVERRGVGEVREVGQRGRGSGVDRARLRLVGLCPLRDDGLALLLQVDVDGEHDVGAVARRDGVRHAAGDGRAVAARLVDALAITALEDVVVVVLEARERGAVLVHITEDLSAGRPVGVDALGVRLVVDAREALVRELLRHLVSLRDVDALREVRVAGARAGQRLQIGIAVAAEDLDEHVRDVVRGAVGRLGGLALLVLDGLHDRRRVADDVLAVDADGKDVAVAVVDGAALGVQGDDVRPAVLGTLGEPGPVDDLDVDEPEEHDDEGRGGQGDEYAHPPLARPHIGAVRGSSAVTRTRGLVIRGLGGARPAFAAI